MWTTGTYWPRLGARIEETQEIILRLNDTADCYFGMANKSRAAIMESRAMLRQASRTLTRTVP